MLLRALFTRPLVRRPARFVLTVLGVAAGVASVVATLTASRAALASLRAGVVDLAGDARLEVRAPGGLETDALGALRPLADDALLAPVVEEIALCPALADTVRLLGVDPLVDLHARRFAPDSERRSVLDFLARRGAWISTELARELHVEPAGSIGLDVRSRHFEIPVLGTSAAPASGALARLVVVDIALAQEMRGQLDRIDRIEIAPRPGVDVDELRARVELLVPPGASVAEPAARARRTDGLVRSLEFNLTALTGISLFAGAVLVATTLATSILQRRRTIALLRTLGASGAQIARAILFEAAAIGVLGGAAGTALGFVAARGLLPSMRATVSTLVVAPASAVQFAWDHALAGFALGVVVALCAAVLPLLEGARLPPIQALKGESPAFLQRTEMGRTLAVALLAGVLAVELVQLPAWRGLPVFALLGGVFLLVAMIALLAPALDLCGHWAARMRRLPASLRLAFASLSAGRRRAAWAAGAIGVATALSVSIATMVTSFRSTVVEWTESSLHADLVVRPVAAATGIPVGRLAPEVESAVAAALPEAEVDALHSGEAAYRGERVGTWSTTLTTSARHGGPQLLDGAPSRPAFERAARERGILVDEAFHHRFGVSAGERIEFELRGVRFERTVTGVFRDYGDSVGAISLDSGDFLAVFPRDPPAQINVFLPDGADPIEARARLARELLTRFQVDVRTLAELRSGVLSVFDATFAITSALQAASALVAVIAVLSVLSALVSERRADLALISAIGASVGQVRASVCAQAGLLGLVGALAGSVAGLAIGIVLVTVVDLQSFHWSLSVLQPWEHVTWTLLSTALVCALAGLIPSRAAHRTRVAGALREEAAP